MPHEDAAVTEETADCQALREQIDTLNKEFEETWLAVSRGATPTPRYRELRRILADLRAEYAGKCGAPSETSALPRHIVSDWRAG